MTDRELLELAAKAAGYTLDGDCDRTDVRDNGGGPLPWNPLVDDGDALRLANKLWLQVRHVHGQVHAGHAMKFWRTESWFPLGDHDAATRRAIVRAAAEIGKQA